MFVLVGEYGQMMVMVSQLYHHLATLKHPLNLTQSASSYDVFLSLGNVLIKANSVYIVVK